MQTPDSTSSPAMVIVGAGHCGGRAALALRTAGWQAAIHLVGDEPHHPYERPPLSKDLLTGDKTAEACALLSDADLLDDPNGARITRHVARVTSIDATARQLTLSDGQTLAYQSLLLATGGKVRTLRIPGGDLPEVMTLRNLGMPPCWPSASPQASACWWWVAALSGWKWRPRPASWVARSPWSRARRA